MTARADDATPPARPLRPTDLMIFGAAKGGTPLMQAMQTIGIDLPLKALVWQDASGVTWLSYNDPAWLAARHGLGSATKPDWLSTRPLDSKVPVPKAASVVSR